MNRILLLIIVSLSTYAARAVDTLTVNERQSHYLTNRYFTQFEDRTGRLSFSEVYPKAFHNSRNTLPFLGYADSAIWIKVTLHNRTSQSFIPITISTGIIDQFELYFVNLTGNVVYLGGKNHRPGSKQGKTKIINAPLLPDSIRTFYLHIRSGDSMAIPIRVQAAEIFQNTTTTEYLIIGFFIGIVIVMALYNLLLFILVKDASYAYYVLYIIFLGLTQWQVRSVEIFSFSLSKPVMNGYLVPLTRIGFWISILLFVREFLQLKKNILKKYRRYYNLLFVLTALPVVFIVFKKVSVAYSLITTMAIINSVVLLIIGIALYLKGFKPAKFFMLGWGLFLITILATIARNKGYIQFNSFTANFILYSSAFELIMFSVALADRINFYRKQNTEAQGLALAIARENEKLITDQNIVLENRVKERTQELIESNKNLSVSIENLKSAQIKLIETEKMASLGQLTAGIAHEINNPINFVSANIKPLKMDLNEIFALLNYYLEMEESPDDESLRNRVASYRRKIDVDFIKSEIQTLLEGIEEGASRTVEIVQSLRAFSRLDDPGLKPADINRSILTTLVILRSTIPYYIEIQPVLDKLPPFNCYPGKINQIFVNLINNSIQAIKAKAEHTNEHILIKTLDQPDNIVIEISDTGIGMTEEVRQHIFDPFFTTKDIGEGTGLGLSIVFGIIEQHQGSVEVKSELGTGTTFRVTLPKGLGL